MDSEEKYSSTDRLAKVLWFFLCIFGALASIGVVFNMLEYPDDVRLLGLGFVGGSATIVGMGLLQLVEAIRTSGTRALTRVRKASVFLLSLCGAAAALGVCFFAVLGKNEMARLMAYGLLSTAAALVLTGSLFLAEAKAMGSSNEEGGGSVAGSSWDTSLVS